MGAASVQLIADPRQTQLAARLIQLGYSAAKVVSELEASDARIDRRQIGVVDSYGNTAAWSGPTKSGFSGHVLGNQFVSMGNAVVGEQVVDSMAATMDESSSLELPDRLMLAIEAGARAGGQLEGQFSAAMLVFGDEPFAEVDLRVDFHDNAVVELRRIYDWFKPLFPYYLNRPYDPDIAREDKWRDDAIVGLQTSAR
jgi:uncharacterized Ntn-hydrolase superfamily protein